MFKNLLGDKMSFREWFAWKLVCIAHKIYNADFYEIVTIGDGHIFVNGSKYGSGIFSASGVDWNDIDTFDTFDEAMDFVYGPEES